MRQKLVRDRIPEIMLIAGQSPSIKIVEGTERLPWLLKKLCEEADELVKMPSIEECADVWEVLMAIGTELGHSESEIRNAAELKGSSCGLFRKGYVLQIEGDGR